MSKAASLDIFRFLTSRTRRDVFNSRIPKEHARRHDQIVFLDIDKDQVVAGPILATAHNKVGPPARLSQAPTAGGLGWVDQLALEVVRDWDRSRLLGQLVDPDQVQTADA